MAIEGDLVSSGTTRKDGYLRASWEETQWSTVNILATLLG